MIWSWSIQAKTTTQGVRFTVLRNYTPRAAGEQARVAIPWADVVRSGVKVKGLAVTELNLRQPVPAEVTDQNGDGKPEHLVLNISFPSNEPVFTFLLQNNGKDLPSTRVSAAVDARFVVTWLKPYDVKQKLPLADAIIQSTMKFYPDPAQLSINAPGQWNYEYGFFLNAVWVRWKETKTPAYFNYVRKWADRFIDDQGRVDSVQYRVAEYRLDDILPARLYLSLYEDTREEKYRKAAEKFRDQLRHQPKTSDGGYWHKEIYPNQMWLDGIYMADVFSVQYAKVMNEPALYDEAIHQIKLIAKHTRDSVTGLFYHGWDESKNKVWADPRTGRSPAFWGRAMGWYIMALVETLDYIPAQHPQRQDVVNILQKLAASIVRYQHAGGLWYQVLDKANQPGNWEETSCSAMFAYAFAKSYRLGYLDKTYLASAKKAFHAINSRYAFTDTTGKVYLDQTVKVATLNPKVSKGDYAYYIGLECRINDYKGLSPWLYTSIELR